MIRGGTKSWWQPLATTHNESNPLYIVGPIYFPSTGRANLTTLEGSAEGIAFVGMADQEGQEEHTGDDSDLPSEETLHWHRRHQCAMD